MNLPSADDLFRPTAETTEPKGRKRTVQAVPDDAIADAQARRSSGRVRHDEKMTVYVTAAELLEIERARLVLRAEHGIAVDRGRLVREAVHLALAELDESGDDSELVRRLSQ